MQPDLAGADGKRAQLIDSNKQEDRARGTEAAVGEYMCSKEAAQEVGLTPT